MIKGLFSSNTDNWATPQYLFDSLNDEFSFTLDPCADFFNHKCDKWYSEFNSGLDHNWQGESVFCNPPYGRCISKWVKKCYYESLKKHTRVVMLLPARTDTIWFHDYIYNKCEIRFIKGRLRFGDSKENAPFPSMICIYPLTD